MNKNVETIVDENGFEILVGYKYEVSASQTEEGHGYHEVGNLTYTELTSVELVIGGEGIENLPRLSERQKDFIISKLTYE